MSQKKNQINERLHVQEASYFQVLRAICANMQMHIRVHANKGFAVTLCTHAIAHTTQIHVSPRVRTQHKAVSVLFRSPLSALLPHPFVQLWIEQVFASVITALAKWPVSVCAAFQTENKTGGKTASLKGGSLRLAVLSC